MRNSKLLCDKWIIHFEILITSRRVASFNCAHSTSSERLPIASRRIINHADIIAMGVLCERRSYLGYLLHRYKFYVLLLPELAIINFALLTKSAVIRETHVSESRHAIMAILITCFRGERTIPRYIAKVGTSSLYRRHCTRALQT